LCLSPDVVQLALEAVQFPLELMPICAANGEQGCIPIRPCTGDPAGFHIHVSDRGQVTIQSGLDEQKPKRIHAESGTIVGTENVTGKNEQRIN
jgi:hypothetical protein